MLSWVAPGEVKQVALPPQKQLGKGETFSTWADTDVENKLLNQPSMQDGAAKLWFFNAGCDCTKEPTKRGSLYRMKSAVDEVHLNSAVSMVSKCLGEGDACIFVSGRNSIVYTDMKRLFTALKPKVGIRELAMEPAEDQLLRNIRIEGSCMSTIDPKDPILVRLEECKDVYKTQGHSEALRWREHRV